MKVNYKKLTASVLSAAMLASLSGCALFDKDDDAVLEAADAYASAVVKLKANKIVDLTADPDEDLEDGLNLLFGHELAPSDDYAAIVSAIESTLSYEVDSESVESSKKKGEASVDVVFSVADYAAAYDEVTADGGDLDAFLAAIADADLNEVEVTLEFVYEDETWLVDDASADNLEHVFDFYTDAIDYSFGAAISPDLIDYIEWYYSDDSVYTDPYTIELDIIPTTEGQEIEWEFYYEYYLDGQLIFTSDACTDQGYWIESYYGESYDSQAALDEDGQLVPGEYRCIVYDMAGNVLADSTCTVVDGASSAVIPDTPSGDMADIWANGVDEYWYSYSDGTGYAMGEGEYGTSETVMEFTCQVNDETNLAYLPVYYEVYYSATGNEDDAEQVYSATITPTEYSNGYFYEFQYTDNGGFDAGTYYFIGATDSTGECMLFFEQAVVS